MLVVETGQGVRGANSYVTAAYVTGYLASRNRSTENDWDSATSTARDAACIEATAYIDWRFGPRFRGRRQFRINGAAAVGTVTVDSLPTDGDTLTIGADTYTFRPSPAAPFEVAIGADAAGTAENIRGALAGDAPAGAVGDRTPAPVGISATIAASTPAVVSVALVNEGEAGNDTPLSQSGAALTLSAFSGGVDGGSQPLEFPRVGLVLPDGHTVVGVPRRLKDATAEYAVRALAASLAADPTTPDGAGPIVAKLERVEGAVTEQTQYASPSQARPLDPYPAADSLLVDYMYSGSRVYR